MSGFELMSKEAYELQSRCDRFIVIKDRFKLGSAIMGFTKEQDQQFRYLLARVDLIAQRPLQVVRIGGPTCMEIYSEYAPYTIITKEQDMLNIAITGECPGKIHPAFKGLTKDEMMKKVYGI